MLSAKVIDAQVMRKLDLYVCICNGGGNCLIFWILFVCFEILIFFVFSSKGHKMKQISVQNDNNIHRTKMYVVEPNRNNDDDVSIEKSKISERWQKITTLLRIWYIIFFYGIFSGLMLRVNCVRCLAFWPRRCIVLCEVFSFFCFKFYFQIILWS